MKTALRNIFVLAVIFTVIMVACAPVQNTGGLRGSAPSPTPSLSAPAATAITVATEPPTTAPSEDGSGCTLAIDPASGWVNTENCTPEQIAWACTQGTFVRSDQHAAECPGSAQGAPSPVPTLIPSLTPTVPPTATLPPVTVVVTTPAPVYIVVTATREGGAPLSPTLGAPTAAPAAEPCRLQKVNTADENSTPANWIRVEVGGSHIQHVDAYARRGIKSVSYIVPAIAPLEAPAIWYMFGSVFEATDAPSCQTFDWVADTTQYAKDRLDSGHSGIVVDLRSGTPVVVANVANLSQADVNVILTENARLMNDPNAIASLTNNVGSCQMTKQTHNPVVGQVWTLSGPGIVNFWSNEPGADQTEHKLLLNAGDTVNLLGGGTFWGAQPGCSMTADFANNPLPMITLAELQSLGLVK